jgi:hypothetical protein
MRTSLALICSLALALIFVAFVCAFATTSGRAINLGELAQSKSTQFARPTDDVHAPLKPLVALIKPQTIKEVAQPQTIKEVLSLVKLGMKYAFFFILIFCVKANWTPIFLGVFLVLTAVFFPPSVHEESSKGHVKLLGSIDVSFQGKLRLAAVMAGILLICIGAVPGLKGAKEAPRSTIHEEA